MYNLRHSNNLQHHAYQARLAALVLKYKTEVTADWQ